MIYIIVDLILLVPRTIYTQEGKLYVILYIVNFIYMLYELRVIYVLLIELRALWEEEKADEEAEPSTEDTVVIEADPTVTPTSDDDKF